MKKIALEAVSLAAETLKKEYYKFSRTKINLKDKNQIVTKHDLDSEKIIIQKIKQHFPEHRILSEEKGDNKKNSDYLWIIDPIDGTTNFSIHNPLWSISLSLVYKNEIILGIILAPILNELYLAEKNKGAFLNGKKIKTPSYTGEKIINTFCHGSKIKDKKRALKYYNYQKINSLDCRQLGSATIELAYTALGRVDSLMIPGAHPWDVAAGALIVKEAGGKVTDFKGKNWTIDSPDILASNPKIHSKLLQIIKKLKI
ncbi:MAG: inositol monophosphatase family protein [Patescibacteria group bacterium]|jgi:myo-inositol-1(or 4)-monophosphatase